MELLVEMPFLFRFRFLKVFVLLAPRFNMTEERKEVTCYVSKVLGSVRAARLTI